MKSPYEITLIDGLRDADYTPIWSYLTFNPLRNPPLYTGECFVSVMFANWEEKLPNLYLELLLKHVV